MNHNESKQKITNVTSLHPTPDTIQGVIDKWTKAPLKKTYNGKAVKDNPVDITINDFVREIKAMNSPMLMPLEKETIPKWMVFIEWLLCGGPRLEDFAKAKAMEIRYVQTLSSSYRWTSRKFIWYAQRFQHATRSLQDDVNKVLQVQSDLSQQALTKALDAMDHISVKDMTNRELMEFTELAMRISRLAHGLPEVVQGTVTMDVTPADIHDPAKADEILKAYQKYFTVGAAHDQIIEVVESTQSLLEEQQQKGKD